MPELYNPLEIDNKELIDPLLPPDDPDKSYEEKIYIILWYMNDDSSDYGSHFKICVGRTSTYDFIKANIDDIDIHESVILTETKQTETKTGSQKYYMTNINKAITAYQFMKKIQDKYKDDFDIEDYNYTFEDEEEGELDINKIDNSELRMMASILRESQKNQRMTFNANEKYLVNDDNEDDEEKYV